MSGSSLSGKVVALPETRELDRLAELLEAEGARTWRCPLVAIVDAPAQAPVEAWVRALASGVPVPAVFLLSEEMGINAFAAGHTPSDCVIGVTRGCSTALKRLEPLRRRGEL